MRDKLKELIKKGGLIIPETAEAVADYLIENNVLILPEQMKDSWELALPFMMRLLVADEAEIEKIKGDFEFSQKNKILTDIRDYLVERKDNDTGDWGYDFVLNGFVEKALADLTEYAEKLGVECEP